LGSLCAALLVLVAGCAQEMPPPVQEGGAPEAEAPQRAPLDVTLALETQALTDREAVVNLRFARQPGLEGPRAAEIFLETSDNLKLSHSLPLEGAQAAGKQLVVQEPSPGLLRVILYATSNLNPMDSGPLASLRFQRTAPGDAYVDFASGQVSLAPAQAARGLRLSPKLVLEATP
jgi:hypothetical protein